MKNLFLLLFCSAAAASVHAQGSELIALLQPYDVAHVSGERRRLGKEYDGGYVVPQNILEQCDAVMSYGIGDDASFELDVIARCGIPVYAFDCGISRAPARHEKLHFFSECIGTDSTVGGKQRSSGRVSSYNRQAARLGLKDKKIFIKMDIEGAEYEAFYSIDAPLLANIQGMVIELHNVSESSPQTLRLLRFFNEHFVLIHLHANNFCRADLADTAFPGVVELTYVHARHAQSKKPSLERFPTALDMPNDFTRQDITLDYWR